MPTSPNSAPTTSTRATDIDYGIDPWKVALIDARARLRGYRRDELDDIRQELAPILAAFVFDTAKSNGACERTVLISIIDNQMTMALRTRARWQRFRTEYGHELGARERSRVERREVPHEVNADRTSDVAQAIRRLPEDERIVAQALMHGERMFTMAKRLGRTRYDIERVVQRIRNHFLACGLDAWVRG